MREWLSPVETVVVLACVCLAVLLLPPAVLAARDDAREEACRARLRDLGRAFVEYASAKGGFPPRRTGFNDGNPYGGWGGQVWPYLDSGKSAVGYDARYDFFDPQNAKIVETPIPAFLCPASPTERVVQIQSQASTMSLNPDKETVFTSKAAAVDFIASNGVLMTESGYGINALGLERGGGNQRQPMTDNTVMPLARVTDGLSQTLLLIEQAGRPAVWRKRAQKTGDGQFGMSPNARGAWAGWGSIAFGAANAETGETPGRGDGTDCSVNCNNWFGIYGFHEGGANVLFCDGRVQFVGEKLDPLTFAYLTVRDDGHLISDDDVPSD